MKPALITPLVFAVAALGAACASPAPAPPPSKPPSHTATERPSPRPQGPLDTCGLASGRALIGRSRLEIPVPVRPENQRVACTTCAVTQDYNPARITYYYDLETGRVTDVRCG